MAVVALVALFALRERREARLRMMMMMMLRVDDPQNCPRAPPRPAAHPLACLRAESPAEDRGLPISRG